MKEMIPIAISLVALLISVINLYLSKLRRGEPNLTAGEHICISHQPEGMLVLILPVNVANAGSKLVTVDRVALLIQQSGSNEGYLLDPAFYLSLAENGTFKYESLSVPLTIFGGENITKQVMFGSSIEHPTEFQMTKAGTYDLTLLAWVHGAAKPRASDRFSIVVSENHVSTLVNWIREKNRASIKLPQSKWRSWVAHPLTAVEVEQLQVGKKA